MGDSRAPGVKTVLLYVVYALGVLLLAEVVFQGYCRVTAGEFPSPRATTPIDRVGALAGFALGRPRRREDGSWDLSGARALQERLRRRVSARSDLGDVRLVAGADVSYGRNDDRARAALVVLDASSLDKVASAVWTGAVAFPYIPGYLSFREAPAVLEAWTRLEVRPDLLMVDGHGLAHPRRFGLACHLGLILGVPAIGVAKSVLVGEYAMPNRERGSRTPLVHGVERVGTALRTRDGVAPVFVSIGHRISLRAAECWVLRCGAGFRLPEPTRLADRLVASRARAGPAG